MTTNETPLHIQQAEALRSLARFIEANPQHGATFRNAFNMINVYVGGDKKAALAEIVRSGLRAGVKVDKEAYGTWFSAVLRFGSDVNVHVNAQRDEVCERIVTGTETVTKKVPDPALLAEVPEVEITEEVETVRWECKPLLAAEASR
jgi:hypothetical protein